MQFLAHLADVFQGTVRQLHACNMHIQLLLHGCAVLAHLFEILQGAMQQLHHSTHVEEATLHLTRRVHLR